MYLARERSSAADLCCASCLCRELQVVVADGEVPSDSLQQQLQGLNFSRSAAGS